MQEDELHALIMREVDSVHQLAFHLRRQSDAADDLVLETYRIAHGTAAHVDPTKHGVRLWLFKILYDLIARRGPPDPPQPSPPGAAPQAVVSSGDAAPASVTDRSAVDWDDAGDRLKQTIQHLPLAQRAVFLLCIVQGFKYRQAAGVLDVSEGEVMALLYEARATVSARLAEPAPGPSHEGESSTG